MGRSRSKSPSSRSHKSRSKHKSYYKEKNRDRERDRHIRSNASLSLAYVDGMRSRSRSIDKISRSWYASCKSKTLIMFAYADETLMYNCRKRSRTRSVSSNSSVEIDGHITNHVSRKKLKHQHEVERLAELERQR